MKNCLNCGAELAPKAVNSRKTKTESPAVFARRKYCDRACMAAAMVKDPMTLTRSYSNQKLAYKFMKAACEMCGTPDTLTVHHEDRNWRNNEPSNIRTLCASCHTSHHHSRGDIVQKQEKPPCKHCGKPSYRSGYCNTCRTRIRRTGNPLMGRAEWIAYLKSPEGKRNWLTSHGQRVSD